MKDPISFLGVLIINLAFTLLVILVYFLLYNRNRLREQGFSNEYIDFIRKMEWKGVCISWLSMMAFQALAYLLISLFADLITVRLYIKTVFLLAVSLTVIVRFIYDKFLYKRQKELAIKTGSEIVVDFNFKLLRLIFKPVLEIISTVIVASFTFVSLQNPPSRDNNYVIYLYLVFIWYFYIAMRSVKNMIMPQFESVYRQNAKFLILFNSILLLLVVTFSMDNIESVGFRFFDYLFLGVVTVLLAGKLVVYIRGYRIFLRELAGKKQAV